MFLHVVQDCLGCGLKITIVVLEICDEFCWNFFLEVKEDCLFNVAAERVDIELLGVDFTQLVDCFVAECADKGEEAGVGQLGVIQDHPVLEVPGRMQGNFFKFVMALQRAVTSSLVSM